MFIQYCFLAGDSHTAALTEKGAVYAWGTYRDATGVFGFAPGVKVGLLATLVWDPKKAADQAVKVASGMKLSLADLLLARTFMDRPVACATHTCCQRKCPTYFASIPSSADAVLM